MKKAFLGAICLLYTTLSAQTITSDFSTNAEGWQTRDNPLGGYSGATYRPTGGNPSGHISAKDALPFSTMYFVAPAKFLGNKSWAYNNALTFDMKIETGTFFSEDDVIIEGNGVVLVFDLPNPTTSWTTFTCPLNETAGWKVGTRNGVAATKTQLQDVLCNLTRLWIRAEYFNNFLVYDEGFMDNVSLGVTACTPSPSFQTKTICSGQSFTLNNKTYNQTGIYKDTIKRCFPQCDSLINLNLMVIDAFRTNKDTTICAGNFIKIGNKTYNQTGIYRDTLKTTTNCDSIISINLTVTSTIPTTQNFTICDIETIKVGNKTYNQTGTYRDTFKTVDNCINIIITNLTVNPTYTSGNAVEICPNGSYTIGTNTYTQAGVYRDVLKTIKGCDSIVTTTITVKNAFSRTQLIKLCQGQIFPFNNHNYTETGIYRDTFRRIGGCDTIIITDLRVNPVYSFVRDTSICAGDFIKIGNKTYNQTGTYRDTLPTFINNCDSIIITNLKLINPLSISRDTSICLGDFIKINNRIYNQTGIYKDTLKGIKGCDSLLITTNLKLINPLSISRDTSICLGDFIKINNRIYNQTGIYKDTLKAINKGCDSILLTINLKIKPERKRLIDSTICEGKTLIINGKQYQKAGNFNDTIKLNGQCDSILLITIKIKPYPIIKKNIVLCANDSALINGRLFTKIGVFKDTIISTINCNEITEWTVTKSNLRLNMGTSPLIELGDSVQLNPIVLGAQNVLWTWTPNKSLSCINCPNPSAKPVQTTIFTLIVRDTTTNCTIKDVIKVSVKPCESIFMPTVFSPNNDGANDYFSVFASGCVRKVKTMKLFNRWGIMVFSNTNFLPNNEKNGWDGRMNNTQLPPDVYVYVIELELGDGTIKLVSGDVTLLR